MRVLIAPDSFKGSADAAAVASALCDGWRAVRPHDDVVELPQADGGEGTLEIIAAAGTWHWHGTEATGPDGRRRWARWIANDRGEAVIELAESSGIALMDRLAPMTATSRGVGEVIAAALNAGAHSLRVALGGSASTDGGAGALVALGLSCHDTVDAAQLRALPPGGVELLVDTAAPLFGPHGAAHVFGPQKGADQLQVRALDERLRGWSRALAAAGLVVDPTAAGAGAAGGVGFGLATWGATFTSGADRIAELSGLADAVPAADVVLAGEGRFDRTSLNGKVVGRILDRCSLTGVRALVIAGQVATDVDGPALSLTDLAGSPEAAIGEPLRWLRAAGARAAAAVSG